MDTLEIKPVALQHASSIQELAEHPDVVATTTLPEPYPEDGARRFIEYVRQRHEAGEELAFVILVEETVVGMTGLDHVTDDDAELGYWIGVPYWGKGYATEAVRHVLQVAFDELDLDEVYALPLEENAASRRVLEKAGFTEVGTESPENPKWEEKKVVRYVRSRSETEHGPSEQ
jgi:RimJ/RimL family protein N-acetyltransferase